LNGAGFDDRSKLSKANTIQLTKAQGLAMRKSLPRETDSRYPIPYVNPPTELRVAVHEARQTIVLLCERAGATIFPAMEFGEDVDAAILRILIRHRKEELDSGCPPEAFIYVKLSAHLGMDAYPVRRRIERLRARLRVAMARNWPGAVFRSDMIVETGRGRGGYRLAPSVRFVALEHLIDS
jgi:hypothetical protein